MCKRLSTRLGWRRNRSVINRDITEGKLMVSILCTSFGIFYDDFALLAGIQWSREGDERQRGVMRQI